MTRRTSLIWWAFGGVLSSGIAIYSYRYLTPGFEAPPGIGNNPMAHPWLLVHAGFAATALLTGPFQFLARLRARWPKVHRWTGRIYVAACLLGGSAGLLLAGGSTAGPIAGAGFAALAVCWVAATGMAWREALNGRFDAHRRWMIRSFAMTFAAVTLRLYLPMVAIAHQPFLEWYRAIAWLAWVPNLVVAELYIGRSRRRPSAAREPLRKAA